ncbi:MAG: hypothetical protein SCK29_10620 [Bacillota bacterium]|nr:hypothetical protein [Bacillota bacterium]MDW7684555.1 hypothetical protein [Bacillota bacterium]
MPGKQIQPDPEVMLYAGLLFAVWSSLVSPYAIWLLGTVIWTVYYFSRQQYKQQKFGSHTLCPQCAAVLSDKKQEQ